MSSGGTMRAWQVTGTGEPVDVLHEVEVPVPEPGRARQRIILKGDVPSPINPPKGCRFHTRCPYVFDRCRIEEPELRMTGDGHFAACHLNELPVAKNPAESEGELTHGRVEAVP